MLTGTGLDLTLRKSNAERFADVGGNCNNNMILSAGGILVKVEENVARCISNALFEFFKKNQGCGVVASAAMMLAAVGAFGSTVRVVQDLA